MSGILMSEGLKDRIDLEEEDNQFYMGLKFKKKELEITNMKLKVSDELSQFGSIKIWCPGCFLENLLSIENFKIYVGGVDSLEMKFSRSDLSIISIDEDNVGNSLKSYIVTCKIKQLANKFFRGMHDKQK